MSNNENAIPATQDDLDTQFVRAINAKNVPAAQEALDAGANIDVANVRGITQLHASVLAKALPMAQWLVQRGANPSLQNLTGDTALHEAAKMEDPDFVKALLGSRKADVRIANSMGATALMEAAGNSRLMALEALLGADRSREHVEMKSKQGASALLIAAGRHQYKMVSALLDAGASANDANSYGVTALISASAVRARYDGGGEENPEVASMKTMEVLIKGGANVNATAKSGNTALAEASQSAHRRGMVLLLSHGANPNVHTIAGVSGEMTPLMMASYKHDIALVNELISRGADVNYANGKGQGAAAMAMMGQPDPKEPENPEKVLVALLSAGAKLSKSSSSIGLAHYAVITKNKGLLQLAKDQGCIDQETEQGVTALFFAVRDRNVEMLDELKRLGASFDAKDKEGNTAMHMLAKQPYPANVMTAVNKMRAQDDEKRKAEADVLEEQAKASALDFTLRMVAAGASLNSKNARGDTPLHAALISFAHGSLGRPYLDFLVEQGADIAIRNEQEESGFIQAVKIGNKDLAVSWAEKLIAEGKQDQVDMAFYDVAWTAPEHEAQVKRMKEVFEALAPLGAKVGYQDEDGQFPLLIAASTNQEDYASMLIELGADVSQRNNEGEVAAFHSIKENRPNITRLLFDHGCDPDSARNDGDTLMAFAYRAGSSGGGTAVQQIIQARQEWRRKLDEAEQAEEASRPARRMAP